jgi:hypothetical protein
MVAACPFATQAQQRTVPLIGVPVVGNPNPEPFFGEFFRMRYGILDTSKGEQ